MERRRSGTTMPEPARRDELTALALYATGLAFTDDRSRVVLILKKRGPPHLVGRWNGVGGRMESGEAAVEAMTREFREETGVGILGWEQIATSIHGRGSAVVSWFRCFTDAVEGVRTTTDEDVHLWAADRVLAAPADFHPILRDHPKAQPIAPHVRLMVALALEDDVSGPIPTFFDSTYTRPRQ